MLLALLLSVAPALSRTTSKTNSLHAALIAMAVLMGRAACARRLHDCHTCKGTCDHAAGGQGTNVGSSSSRTAAAS
jgi:hypothetical protein